MVWRLCVYVPGLPYPRLLAHPTLQRAPIVLRFLQHQNWRQFLTITDIDGQEKKWTGQTSIDHALKKISGKPREPDKRTYRQRHCLRLPCRLPCVGIAPCFPLHPPRTLTYLRQ